MIIFDHSLLENLSLGIYKVTFTFSPPLWLLLYVLVFGVPLSWSDPLEIVFHRTSLIPFSLYCAFPGQSYQTHPCVSANTQ